ncbi:hypothetical protein BHECKSOX_1955 [Bathymodiolus heckerae thiotrophic gill symbiont]|jgi:hypothetical protein|uniref:hypothetical protein n=1 Tax=Bathymodiolus heckerae thiotrophic gill symbiont TaxID=1052212 RepID=UPI0010B43222|nr:hypothetical protein [Bathymodiolus heckerae thiotrophic gill symbiont]SHN92979.1 hypothetical protein BHECKSOX_1955 [Bathymodiolus heckerae thiotrophic gill symbiont]
MKAKPTRKELTPKEQVIKEAMKIDSDDIVTMTFKVPRELQQGYKMEALKNSESMTDAFITHMKSYIKN